MPNLCGRGGSRSAGLSAAIRALFVVLSLLLVTACGGGGGGGGPGTGTPAPPAATLTALAITPANPALLAGATVQLKATGTFSDGTTVDLTTNSTWTSSATFVATVSSGGLVTAVNGGNVTISVSFGGISSNTSVTVTPRVVSTLTFIHNFQGDTQTNGPLLQASDGNFYSTTRAGGGNICSGGDFCGTLFRLTPGGVKTVLHAFGAGADGNTPTAPLIQGSDGALYGLTSFGGVHGRGTAFRIALDGTYTVLYSFGASPADGRVPLGGLVQASDGNFYGTTSVGGANHCLQVPGAANNCGTIFRMTPAGAVTVIYSFGASASDGVQPNGSLLQGSDGNLYGTTVNGGACTLAGITNSCGTVFRVTLGGSLNVLYSFGNSLSDGIAPQGSLIQGVDGAYYGTTVSGGGGQCNFQFGCGTVFRMTAAGQVTLLYRFAVTNGRSDGSGPSPYLIQAKDGNFYGTTGSGGAIPADLTGTVFQLTPNGTKTILYSFGPLTGSNAPSNPVGGLIQAADGGLYGQTFYGGPTGAGVVFKVVVQ